MDAPVPLRLETPSFSLFYMYFLKSFTLIFSVPFASRQGALNVLEHGPNTFPSFVHTVLEHIRSVATSVWHATRKHFSSRMVLLIINGLCSLRMCHDTVRTPQQNVACHTAVFTLVEKSITLPASILDL